MAMADDERDDLSVRLDWPVDPLAETPVGDDPDPLVRLENRLAALESREVPDGQAMSREVTAAIDDVSARLDYVATELIEALRNMNETFRLAFDDTADAVRQLNDTVSHAIQENTAALDDKVSGLRTAIMSMLASRQAEEQRVQRREREALLAKLEQDLTTISRGLTEAIAAARTQSDVFADRVAAELQALRRRIPVKGRGTGAVDDKAVDAIVSRVADEVEIRVMEAVRPKQLRKRS